MKWPYLKPEPPFPRPIILGIQPLVFGGVIVSIFSDLVGSYSLRLD